MLRASSYMNGPSPFVLVNQSLFGTDRKGISAALTPAGDDDVAPNFSVSPNSHAEYNLGSGFTTCAPSSHSYVVLSFTTAM
ncbi:hypothetical protein FOQG_19505 [Fusarium oxysporum f. sp. raphani 54005]|uniref:Uncharacterized protein n=1 Tax=Fusarium oxysporum f. sp. raphani 54005 TaxID=1089458 RepID=X0B0W3_FUSOX|nr:hypothetical protein FOQG_19505 [Fusarium oxysporum f. sp. raphani 54005]